MTVSPSSYKTNRRPKNRSIEEKLERLADRLESQGELLEFDEEYDDTHSMFRGMEYAENRHLIYERIGNYIDTLERFRSRLDLPNEAKD